MAITARVSLGTVGASITRVKLQTCTGSNCTTCTDLAGFTDVLVTAFQPSGLTISTIPDGTLSINVLALDSACSTTTQCIPITFIDQTTTTTTTTSTSTTTTTSTTTSTTTQQPSVQYCMGYDASNCCVARDDFFANCGPF
jgi:hypothetical protein